MKKQWVIIIYLEAEEHWATKYFDDLQEVGAPHGVSVSDSDLEEVYVPLYDTTKKPAKS